MVTECEQVATEGFSEGQRDAHGVGVAKAPLDISLLPDKRQGGKAIAGFSPHSYQDKGAPTFQGLHASLHSNTSLSYYYMQDEGLSQS